MHLPAHLPGLCWLLSLQSLRKYPPLLQSFVTREVESGDKKQLPVCKKRYGSAPSAGAMDIENLQKGGTGVADILRLGLSIT